MKVITRSTQYSFRKSPLLSNGTCIVKENMNRTLNCHFRRLSRQFKMYIRHDYSLIVIGSTCDVETTNIRVNDVIRDYYG